MSRGAPLPRPSARIEVTLYEVLPGARDLQLELTAASTQRLHERFGGLCRNQTKRSINWRESFARRGLAVDEYAFEESAPAPTALFHHFKKLDDLESGVAPCQSFEQSGDRNAILQGDVLTYEEIVPVLDAKRVASFQVDSLLLRAALVQELAGRCFLLEPAEANRACETIALPDEQVRFHFDVVRHWGERSFASFTLLGA
jgi:hypothetical protein